MCLLLLTWNRTHDLYTCSPQTWFYYVLLGQRLRMICFQISICLTRHPAERFTLFFGEPLDFYRENEQRWFLDLMKHRWKGRTALHLYLFLLIKDLWPVDAVYQYLYSIREWIQLGIIIASTWTAAWTRDNRLALVEEEVRAAPGAVAFFLEQRRGNSDLSRCLTVPKCFLGSLWN